VTGLMMVFNRNRSQVFTSKCGPSAMSSSPRPYRFKILVRLRVVFIGLGIGTSVLTFIPVSPLLDHK